MSFISKTQSILGIDLGSSSIKIVQLDKKDGVIKLGTYGIAHESLDIVRNEDDSLVFKAASVLRKLVSKSGVTTKKIVSSFPSPAVFVLVLELTAASEQKEELKKAVEWEARRYIPLPLEEVVLSWHVISEAAGKTKVLLTAVPNRLVDKYVKLFRQAGLEPVALEVESLALARSLIKESKLTTLLLDFGASTTTMNIIKGGVLNVSKSIDIGGETITKAIATSLNIDESRAEQFKRDLGIRAQVETGPKIIRQVADQIILEIKKYLDLYESQQEIKVEKILASGGGLKLAGFLKYVERGLGRKIEIGQPWVGINYPAEIRSYLENVSSLLAIAAGSALRELKE